MSRWEDKRRQRIRARAKGFCAVCCARKPPEGKKTCVKCLARAADRVSRLQAGFKKAKEIGLV